MKRWLGGAWVLILSLACTANPVVVVTPGSGNSNTGTGGNSNTNNGAVFSPPSGETGRVTRVVDGDTIDVDINGEIIRVRYLGMNTTETNRGEVCAQEGKSANAALVEGRTVTLVPDRDPTDRYGRALRYVYVGSTFVNAELVRQGWAEAVMYEPNDAHWDEFIALEQAAERGRRGCHGMSDIFDDNRYDR